MVCILRYVDFTVRDRTIPCAGTIYCFLTLSYAYFTLEKSKLVGEYLLIGFCHFYYVMCRHLLTTRALRKIPENGAFTSPYRSAVLYYSILHGCIANVQF